MNVIVSKVLSASTLILSAVIGCLIPTMLTTPFKSGESEGGRIRGEGVVCLCNCLAAGVIMGMSFLHILPETVDQCLHSDLFVKIRGNKLNLAFVLMLVSLSLMLFMERVLSFGRTPCSSTFNECKGNSKCCVIADEESLVARDAHSLEAQTIPEDRSVNFGVGSRYKHKHTRIMATIKNILCPICDCNGLCITLALFIHSVFEGLIVGLEENEVHLWLITLGIVLHKWAAGMALASFVRGNAKSTVMVMFTLFCSGSPLGVLIGSFILDSQLSVIAVLNSIAVGTLVYVGLEIIVHELFCEIKCKKTALYKWLFYVTGLLVIFAALMLEFLLANHSHDH